VWPVRWMSKRPTRVQAQFALRRNDAGTDFIQDHIRPGLHVSSHRERVFVSVQVCDGRGGAVLVQFAVQCRCSAKFE
jgi:hypothetical protein